MRIAIDYDDTLVDSQSHFLDRVREDWGLNVRNSDITTYLYHNHVPIPVGEKEFWKYYHHVMHVASHEDLNPLTDAQEIIPLLSEEYDLYIATARGVEFQQKIEGWIDYYFPNQFKEVITGLHAGKASALKERNIDLLVEDAEHNVRNCVNDDVDCVLYHQRHNSSFDYEPRAYTWSDVEKIVRDRL